MKLFAQGAPGATLTATVYTEDGSQAMVPSAMAEEAPGFFSVDFQTEPGEYYALVVSTEGASYPPVPFYGEGAEEPEVELSEPEPQRAAPKGVRFTAARRF